MTVAEEKGILLGKKALVTGAGRGIGREVALSLARAGADVAVHYGSSASGANDVVAEIRALGRNAIAVQTDLATTGAAKTLIDQLVAADFVPLDILVNNAALAAGDFVATTTEADYDRMMAVNVRAPFFITQMALPHLNDGGSIINFSSMVAFSAFTYANAYAMSKAAINLFTRSTAADLGSRGIRVNAVAPGPTDTDLLSGADEQAFASMRASTALGRLGQPADIAGVVTFLASPPAAWITGQVIQVSGGYNL